MMHLALWSIIALLVACPVNKNRFYIPLSSMTDDNIRTVVNAIHQPLSRSMGKSSPSSFSNLMLNPSSGGKGVRA